MELLVVVAVIAVLVALGVPSLAGARESAQSMIGMTNVRRLANGQSAYAFMHDSWLAGPNTSGAAGIVSHGRSLEGNTTPATPTSTHDWISPTLGDELRLAPNRAERTAQIFDVLACPRARLNPSAILWGGSRDRDDFERVRQERGFGQISYLAPSAFHYRPQGGHWTPRALDGPGARPMTGIERPFRTPARYRPRLDTLDRPEAKVLVADGTRYVTEQRGARGTGYTLDFDVSPEPGIYGSFTSSGPIFERSRAYGRTYLATSDLNVRLSMRFFDRQMHVAYFDTHAARLEGGEVWADPTPWYPRGSVFTGGEATPEVAARVGSDPQRYGKVP